MNTGKEQFDEEIVVPVTGDMVSHELYCMDNEVFLSFAATEYVASIDFCYIDPPYNTGRDGKTGFTYNDSFHVKGDVNRHASWLAFMRPRLEGLLPVLKDTGVVAISIDDSEIHHLRLLCDEIFGEQNFVAQMIIDGGAMKNNARLISTTHEYLLVYAKSLKALNKSDITWREEREGISILRDKEAKLRKIHKTDYAAITGALKIWVKTAPIPKRLKSFFNADASGLYTHADLSSPNSKQFYDYLHPVTGKPVKTPSRGWAYAYDNLDALAKRGEIDFFVDESYQPLKKHYLKDGKDQVIKSVHAFSARSSTHLLENMLGRRSSFNNPKNLEFISYLVDTMCPEDGVVLDYFAGSGTTGHAVIDLNKNSSASRKAILCSKDENAILETVTIPRLQAALTGQWGNGTKHKASVDGLKIYSPKTS